MDKDAPVQNRVKELRSRLGMRQSDLAQEIGVTRQTIIAIEKGRLNPSILIVLKIARVLREPVDYVFHLSAAQEGPGTTASDKIAARPAVRRPPRRPEPAPVGAAAQHDEAGQPAAATVLDEDPPEPVQAFCEFF